MHVILSHLILSSCVSSLSLCYLIINELNYVSVLVCRYDYLRISNDSNYTVGTYCRGQSGRNISVTGPYPVITFHSDGSVTYRGYKFDVSFVLGKYKESEVILLK